MLHPVRVVGPSYRNPPKDVTVVNTTSKTGWSSDLSPFLLGPVPLYDGIVSITMENAWQYSKVYERHLDENGNPSDNWLVWAIEGWGNPTAVRYPMGKGKKPVYSWWAGEKLGYVTARKKIYVPLYARAVVRTKGFKQLRQMYEEGKQLVLWDWDGYDHLQHGLTLQQVLDSQKRMGHAFVLAMLLERHSAVQQYLGKI